MSETKNGNDKPNNLVYINYGKKKYPLDRFTLVTRKSPPQFCVNKEISDSYISDTAFPLLQKFNDCKENSYLSSVMTNHYQYAIVGGDGVNRFVIDSIKDTEITIVVGFTAGERILIASNVTLLPPERQFSNLYHMYWDIMFQLDRLPDISN